MSKNVLVRAVLCTAVILLTACSPSHRAHGKAAAPQAAALARGEVEVQGGLLKIHAEQAGNVVALAVAAGQKVKRGQVLARLRNDKAKAAEAVARARWREAQAQAHLLAVQLPALQSADKRWAAAVREGAAGQQHADKANLALQQLQARLAVAKKRVHLARAQLEQARVVLRALTLRAPVAGTVIKVGVQVGSRVVPDSADPAFTLQPQRPLVVRAEVNEAFIDRLHKGMSATLTLEADPGGSPLPAHVQRISDVLQPARLDVDPQSKQRVVVCFLTLDHPAPLLIGQHVLVRFHDKD